VLVHDFLASHVAWDDVFDALAERHHVIGVDLPGFGDSEKPSPLRYRYGLEAFAESLADLIAAFGVGRSHVVGHGLGGAAALMLAATHPELVHRLVVLAPTAFPALSPLGSRLPLRPVVGALYVKQLLGRATFRRYFREQVFGDVASCPASRVDHHYDRFNQPSGRESAFAVMRAMTDTRALVARLGRVRAPTLVVWGRDDRVTPVAQAPRLLRELTAARLEVLDCGHSPAEERPAEVSPSILRFVAG
jgi:pimeloyl-ACP methyl ester carboxylesterase